MRGVSIRSLNLIDPEVFLSLSSAHKVLISLAPTKYTALIELRFAETRIGIGPHVAALTENCARIGPIILFVHARTQILEVLNFGVFTVRHL